MNDFRKNRGILSEIAEKVSQRLEVEKNRTPLSCLKGKLNESKMDPAKALATFQLQKGRAIIAEIKLASPSKGPIAMTAQPVDVAGQYLDNGATAISILTEQDYFKGKIEYLRDVRHHHPESVLLMKDFFVDPYQLYQAVDAGANIILLIMSLLDKSKAKDMLQQADSLGLLSLVETHDDQEVADALDIGANFIGINNRNLKTMTTNIKTSLRVIDSIPSDVFAIAESGIEQPKDLQLLREAGFGGFLVGTSLMVTPQPGLALKNLLGGLQ